MAIADILLTPADIWYAPVGEAAPADSVARGADWGGDWESLGYTLAPLTLSYEQETAEVMVEQLTAPVKRKKTSETLTLETTLAEFTGTNLEMVFGGTATDTPAGAGQPAKTELVMGGDTALPVYAWGFEGTYEDANGVEFPVRVIVYRGRPILGGELQFAKAEPSGLPLRIEAEANTALAAGAQLMKIIKITAAAAGS
jgi:hypothetical protein